MIMRDYPKQTTASTVLPNRGVRVWVWMACVLMAATLAVSGCKSKKVVAETPPPATDMEDSRIADAKAALQDLLNSPQSRTFAELEGKERKLADIVGMNLDDGEVMVLIKKVEYKLEQERAYLEAEEARKRERAMYDQLASRFDAIANAGSISVANARIDETLDMFASDDVLVLVVVSEENGRKDYDRPTDIKKYLNYLKDQKQSKNAISNIEFDSNGKIAKLELAKNY